MNFGTTQWVVRGAGNGKHTHAHTHTYSVLRDTQGGWSLGQGSDAILTHASVAPPLIKLMGYEHREDAMGGGGSKQCQIHTHTHTECHTGWMEPRDKDHTQS